MSQLKELIKKIDDLVDQNPRSIYVITVTDLNTNQVIDRNKPVTEISEEYQQIENYFNHLHDQGHTNLSVQLRSKNGNAFKNIGTAVHAEPVTDVAIVSNNTVLQTKKKKKKKKSSDVGLFGLGAMQIMDLHSKANQLNTTLVELAEIKADNKNLKATNEALNAQVLEKKFSDSTADSKNNMYAELIKSAPVALPMLLGAIKEAINPNAGLSAASQIEQPAYSEQQQIMVTNLSLIDETVIVLLNKICEKIVTRKPEETFTTELMELMNQHKLKVV